MVGTLAIDAAMGEAIRAFGLNPDRLHTARLAPGAAAYLEFHIEQGPVLESLGVPLGVVDTIVGQSRLDFVFLGKANHAGTTPMPVRSDALAAAAEWVVEVERGARGMSGLVATVGRVSVSPNASNVIPGTVRASLDVRHASDSVRIEAVGTLVSAAREICGRRGIGLRAETRLDQSAVALDPKLSSTLGDALRTAGYPLHTMSSGAGHDAMILAPVVPSAMLFLRSPGGISHHPDESVIPEDVEAALETGLHFLYAMADQHV
jgi:allantoate deiminase